MEGAIIGSGKWAGGVPRTLDQQVGFLCGSGRRPSAIIHANYLREDKDPGMTSPAYTGTVGLYSPRFSLPSTALWQRSEVPYRPSTPYHTRGDDQGSGGC